MTRSSSLASGRQVLPHPVGCGTARRQPGAAGAASPSEPTVPRSYQMTLFRPVAGCLAAIILAVLLPLAVQAQNAPRPEDTLGTLGAAIPMPTKWTPPTGPAPRLP